MNTSIWEKIAGIPWWVYLAFAYIAYVQCLSLKSRTIDIAKAALPILGLISLATGVLALQLSMNPQLITIQLNFYLLSAVCAGLMLGFAQVKLLRIQFNAATKTLIIPGSWINFFLGITSIAVAMYLKQRYGIQWITSPLASTLWCALLTGLAGGRLVALSHLMKLA